MSVADFRADFLEELFDTKMFPMLRHFHVAGAAASFVSMKECDADDVQRGSSRGSDAKATTSRTSGKIFSFSKAFGYNNLDTDELVDINTTPFDSGRCARMLCALALAELAKEGKIDMKNQVSRYVGNISDSLAPTLTLEDLFVATKKPDMQHVLADKDRSDSPDIESLTPDDWEKEADRCAVNIIEKVSGMDFASYMVKKLMPKLNLPYTEVTDSVDCFTYIYKNNTMLQMKTLQSKLLPNQGLITTTTQMNKMLAAVLQHVARADAEGCGEESGYELLPGFGFGFKSVKLWQGSPTVFVCVSALEDNGNALICVEPRSKWALWIACNTAQHNKENYHDIFKGEPLCYFMLKEFISALRNTPANSPAKHDLPWVCCPSTPRADRLVSLYCFPYMGGSGLSIFEPWFALMPEYIEVKAISLPGRGKRIKEEPCTDLLYLAERIAIGILPMVRSEKFAFYGDGVGALLAFEVARYLELNHGICPLWCFFSCSPSPVTYTRKPRKQKADRGPDSPIKSLEMNLDVVDRLCNAGKLPSALQGDPLLVRAMLPSIQADLCMEAKYRYRRCPFTFCSKERYFFEGECAIAKTVNQAESPQKGDHVLQLRCPITVFGEPENSEADQKGIEQWQLATDAAFDFIGIQGSRAIDKDHKTREEITSVISQTIGHTLTYKSRKSWIGWAARPL